MSERAVVFDKAAWHLESVREHGLADHQAFVHGGLFFGWAVDRGLHASWLEQRTPEVFERYRQRVITGPELFASWDGAILDDMFGDIGLAFVASYFDPKSGAYFGDYIQQIAKGLPSEFHVPDDAHSATQLRAMLDARFDEWSASWDRSQGRPDLRSARDDAAALRTLPEQTELGIIVVTAGIPLPGGPLGVRVARQESLQSVERALREDRLIGLLVARRGRQTRYGPEDLFDTGVIAEIRDSRRAPDRPEAVDLSLFCLARFEVDGWIDRDALRAKAFLLPEPEPSDDDRARLITVRALAADVVRKRTIRGEPPGMLALATVHDGALLVDLVARELPLTREETLILLEADDLGTRLDVTLGALAREE